MLETTPEQEEELRIEGMVLVELFAYRDSTSSYLPYTSPLFSYGVGLLFPNPPRVPSIIPMSTEMELLILVLPTVLAISSASSCNISARVCAC